MYELLRSYIRCSVYPEIRYHLNTAGSIYFVLPVTVLPIG